MTELSGGEAQRIKLAPARQTYYSAQLGALAPLIDGTSRMAGFWQSWFDHLEDLLKRKHQ